MLSTKHTSIVGVHLFLIRDGKVLLIRRRNTGYEDGKYSVPAGHLEADETIVEGILREAREEIGINIEEKEVKVVHCMHRHHEMEQKNTLDFFMRASHWSGEIFNCEPDKCDDVSWFALNDLPENIISYIQIALLSFEKGEVYSEFGWEIEKKRGLQ